MPLKVTLGDQRRPQTSSRRNQCQNRDCFPVSSAELTHSPVNIICSALVLGSSKHERVAVAACGGGDDSEKQNNRRLQLFSENHVQHRQMSFGYVIGAFPEDSMRQVTLFAEFGELQNRGLSGGELVGTSVRPAATPRSTSRGLQSS